MAYRIAVTDLQRTLDQRRDASFSEKVRDLLEKDPGQTNISRTAGELSISPSTLKRRLREEGTTFRELRQSFLQERNSATSRQIGVCERDRGRTRVRGPHELHMPSNGGPVVHRATSEERARLSAHRSVLACWAPIGTGGLHDRPHLSRGQGRETTRAARVLVIPAPSWEESRNDFPDFHTALGRGDSDRRARYANRRSRRGRR